MSVIIKCSWLVYMDDEDENQSLQELSCILINSWWIRQMALSEFDDKTEIQRKVEEFC